MMTDELLLKQDADYRMNPPLREKEDCLAVLLSASHALFFLYSCHELTILCQML